MRLLLDTAKDHSPKVQYNVESLLPSFPGLDPIEWENVLREFLKTINCCGF